MRIALEALAEDLSRLVIASEIQPGPGYSTAIWELALCVREELKAMRSTAGGLPPLKFHYTMRDALWDAKMVVDAGTNHTAAKEA